MRMQGFHVSDRTLATWLTAAYIVGAIAVLSILMALSTVRTDQTAVWPSVYSAF